MGQACSHTAAGGSHRCWGGRRLKPWLLDARSPFGPHTSAPLTSSESRADDTHCHTVDLGTTWRQGQGLPDDQSVEAIAGQPSSSRFFAYCDGGDIYVSTDGGGSWTVLIRTPRSRAG